MVIDEPVFQSFAENRPFTETMQAEHRGFDQRATMVTDAVFPAFATVFANIANRIITLQLRLFAVAVSIVGEPKRHVVAVDQCLVMFCSVSDFERRASFRTHDLLRLRVVLDGFDEPDYSQDGIFLRLFRVF